MKYDFSKHIGKLFIVMAALVMTGLNSCKEDIDESNLYTFTGETIEDYIVNRPEQFSNFNYILKRIGYDQILSAYGTYTCFAPTNDAVTAYVDSLYDDMSKDGLPHNGMTSRGLEGLTDSLCNDIALFHLLYSEVMGVDMNSGMTISTMLGRDINTSIDPESKRLVLNDYSQIVSMDNELENGVLHEIDHVLTRSNNLIAGELSKHEEFTIFNQALVATTLADSLSGLERRDVIIPQKYNCNKSKDKRIYTPGRGNNAVEGDPGTCKLGYTIFAETDEVLKANGINNLDDLAAFAAKVYGNCAKQDGGWYDYFRNHGIEVSTGTDYSNPYNALNMFMRYHILEYMVSYDNFFFTDKEGVSNHASAPIYEYMETMLPYTLMKLSRINGVPRINRWVTNSTLTDREADLASPAIATVMKEGILVNKDNIQSLNGYIHPINGMLVYDYDVPHGTLNERMRFDITSFLHEMMTNGLRRMNPKDVKARAGGTFDTFGGDGNMRIPENFCKNIRVYNGDNSEIYYLPGQDRTWANYQGDELLCNGAYDFALRLPPVPDGTYEVRLGYSANTLRGMMQCYIGRSPSLSDMNPLDIPLDMRHMPYGGNEDNAAYKKTEKVNGVETITYIPDEVTGWLPYASTSDMGVESDANMRSLGWMRGTLVYLFGNRISRAYLGNLRRI
ncbi:MAG: fasciclin domain-containing protein, partial [Prevotella sp.]|nr:fasciclin domain-containing protein [Prevotella sp.]